MARRTKEDAAATRELLLDAAEREFREKGATRTSLAEVASAAGVTRGAVYWHFRDKSDLFAAMCARAKLPMETLLERAGSTAQDDPLATLRSLMSTALARLATDRRTQAVFEVLFHKCELTDELAPIAQRHRQERNLCLAQVERVLIQAVEAGQLPSDTDTMLATHALHAFIGGLMREWVLDKEAYDLAAVAPGMVEMIVSGLKSDPPRRQDRVRPRVRARHCAAD
jgi:TetR/AcrR family transcriptional regulator, acrAB operon repressor